MLATSTAGARTGKSPTLVSRVISGRPETHTATSVDVPPMSKVRMRSKPAYDATNDAPLTPPAGPDRTVWTGFLHAASRLISPPSERTTWIGARTCAAARPSRTFVRYFSSAGATYAFTNVVTVRSYSRNSGRISDEIESGRSGATEAAISAITRSWRPLAWALSRQT